MTAEMYGFNPPFIGGPQNVLSRQEDEQLIKNDMLQLLLTIPGERVMRPTFGVNLRNAVFEQSDEDTVANLVFELRQAIEQNEPRVIVNDVQITTDADRHGMTIKILTTMRSNPAKRINITQFIGFSGSY